MERKVMLGFGEKVVPAPLWLCKAGFQIAGMTMRTIFPRIFSEEHFHVRKFLFMELIRLQKPISCEHIVEKLSIPIDRVRSILNAIAKNQIWIIRNEQGEVTWTYPVTVEETKFKITYSTGEQVWGP